MTLRLAAAIVLLPPVAVVTLFAGAMCIVLSGLAWPFARVQDLGQSFFRAVRLEIRRT